MATRSQVPPFKEFAIGVCMRSGTILMRNFHDHRNRRQAAKKSRYELVTKSDKEVDRFVRYKMRQQFPDHNFISEEGKAIQHGSEYTWVSDPLDGTLNYTIGNPFFATSLTLLKNNEPVIAVTYAPYTQEMFVAERGRAARLNERNMTVSTITKLENSVIAFAYFEHSKKQRQRLLNVWSQFEEQAQTMRHFGCTSLEMAYVACGRMEAQIMSPPLRLWDIMGGQLMVEMAGGTVTNFSGKPWSGLAEGLVSSNGRIHSQVLRVLKRNGLR